jgi:hypothetical protein
VLDDAEFWRLIGTLGGRPEDCDDEPYQRLTGLLTREPVEKIVDFAETLAFKLYDLDRKALAQLDIVENDGTVTELSDDGFLYARCAVIVAGPEAYATVLAVPESFARFGKVDAAHAESLLDVASDAYTAKTCAEWQHVEEYDYETGSNEQYW